MASLGKNNKWIILKTLERNQEDIRRVIFYMREELNTAHRMHSANDKNISSCATRLAEYKGYRNGMINALTYAGFDIKFDEDGETVVDITERSAVSNDTERS